MTYEFRELDDSHHHQLLQLSKETNTGSDRFYVDRSPHFFSLSEEFGVTRHFGLFREKELIGCVAVSEQKRVLNQRCEKVYYVNDLRIHPDYHRTFAFYRLAEHLLSFYRSEGTVKWMFSTVLDSNTNKVSMTKGGGLLPGGVEIARTIHIGVPMFLKYRNSRLHISEIDGQEAWGVYKKLARTQSFAPCGKQMFLRENGVFLVIKDDNNKECLAICKLVDQSNARKLRLSSKLPFSFRIVNLFCRIANCPPLPNQDEAFRHGYMAFFAAKEKPQDYQREFISYIQNKFKQEYSYLFFGISIEEAQYFRNNPFYIKLTSTTFAYGDIPANLSMDFHELTLI
ncbi:GNAT family N-acetyltransferase [Fredinandcohnia sp. QZ13]|uniref:GNAT family N-acetyltransferase n=1 Tax=Fredinandcohnia sp. QZ13 TaxID=3073144 RepID=UPI00285350A2|nr:GNAT family N-acetyltransferase [Fredinandcohnia sp. QZ13]MDR4887251.1 GNAT family N-acetyltransferase [Fredinandcohnia sp. QZ13]